MHHQPWLCSTDGWLLVHDQLNSPAHHELCQVRLGVGRLRGADHLAVPDHSDLVRDLPHLTQLVGDEHDRLAFISKRTHHRHELVGLLWREHCGRLVQDQIFGVVSQRLQDLDPLLHAYWKLLYDSIRIHVEPVAFREPPHGVPRLAHIEQAGGGVLPSKNQVLGHTEDIHQHEVLVDHADPSSDGLFGVGRDLLDAVNRNHACIGL